MVVIFSISMNARFIFALLIFFAISDSISSSSQVLPSGSSINPKDISKNLRRSIVFIDHRSTEIDKLNKLRFPMSVYIKANVCPSCTDVDPPPEPITINPCMNTGVINLPVPKYPKNHFFADGWNQSKYKNAPQMGSTFQLKNPQKFVSIEVEPSPGPKPVGVNPCK